LLYLYLYNNNKVKRMQFFYLFILTIVFIKVNAQPIAKAKDVQIVIAPNTKVNCSGGLTFVGITSLKNDGSITINTSSLANEDWLDSVSSGVMQNTSTGLVTFNGLSQQRVYGATTFNNLTINNKTTVLLETSIGVKGILNLDTGYVTTNANTLAVTNTLVGAILSTSNYSKSWINGKLSREQNIGGSDYFYPIGKIIGTDSFYAPIFIDKVNNNSANYLTEYFRTTPIDFTNFQNPPLQKLSQLEYWQILSSNYIGAGDDDAKLTLSYRGSSVVNNSQAVRDSLMIAQYTNTPRWEPTGGGFPAIAVSTMSPNFGYIKHNASVNAFDVAQSNFTLASRSLFNILPYKIISWSAIKYTDKVNLIWNVETDFEVQKYIVEKAVDANNFTTLQSTPSLQKNSSSYSFYDYAPAEGWNYYKLKIMDKQNNTVAAGIRKVWYGTGFKNITVYPNPTTKLLIVPIPNYNANTILQIIDANGKIIQTQRTIGTLTTVDVGHFPSGTYFLNIIQGSTTLTTSFVKQ
jgi:hypothetical protein